MLESQRSTYHHRHASSPARMYVASAWMGVLAVALYPPRAGAQQQSPRNGAPRSGGSAAASATAPLVFKGVTVVDVETGKLLADQSVVVENDRITALGGSKQVRLPAGARVVDAQGKYLIPGLWNMHSHISDHLELTTSRYEDFIANGITGTRELAQRFPGGADSFRIWRREILAGTRVGPRIVGPSADLSGGNGIDIASPEDARRIVDSLKAAGDAFAKYHGTPDDRETYFALLREARRVGLPIVGHKPSTVTETELSDSGMRSLEHIAQVQMPCWFEAASAPLGEECATMAAHFVRNGTWLTPTIVRRDPFNNFESRSRGCRPDSSRGDRDPDALDIFGDRRFLDLVGAVGKMHRAGVPLLAGSDGGAGVLIFGCALHVELTLLVEAGLTPLEALQTATLNPAKFFDATDSLGTVATGKLADLVLLDANPLADIHNTKSIRAVVANGRYFDRAALDSIVARLR